MNKLKMCRALRGLTVKEAAHLIGISKPSLDWAESGKKISVINAGKLAKFYDLPVAEVLQNEEV